VRADDAYADWEDLYADNVVRLYRLLYSRVATGATSRTSPPRCSWRRSGRSPRGVPGRGAGLPGQDGPTSSPTATGSPSPTGSCN